METSSSSGLLKRARAHGSVNQVPSCLVDGCTADLSKCKDYHRRHKVCEVHSKTPKVTIRGVEQRFCQQCSRFHSLAEFDEGKRSCRKRLDGHNRRRRKPQPGTLPLNPGRFLPNQQGARFLPFGNPQVFSTTAVTSAWVEAIKAEADVHSEINFSSRDNLLPGSSSHNCKEEKQFPFLQGTTSSLLRISVCQPHFDSSSSTGNCVSGRKMFSSGSSQIIDSSSALSLLSSQPAGTRQIVQPDTSQALIPNLHYNSLGTGSERAGSLRYNEDHFHGRGNTHLHEQDVLGTSSHVSTASGSHQTLSFSWE